MRCMRIEMNYTHFTEEQIQELETIFGIKRAAETVRVRDGRIAKGDMVWWRANIGPEHVDSSSHWENIERYPDVYQIATPVTRVIYED